MSRLVSASSLNKPLSLLSGKKYIYTAPYHHLVAPPFFCTPPPERGLKFSHIFLMYKSRCGVIIRSIVHFISKHIYGQLSPKTTHRQ